MGYLKIYDVNKDILRYLIYKDIYQILEMETVKFLQSMDEEQFKLLEKLAVKKRMSVQNYVRFIVFPEWLEFKKIKQ